jgi:hypothetical protein
LNCHHDCLSNFETETRPTEGSQNVTTEGSQNVTTEVRSLSRAKQYLFAVSTVQCLSQCSRCYGAAFRHTKTQVGASGRLARADWAVRAGAYQSSARVRRNPQARAPRGHLNNLRWIRRCRRVSAQLLGRHGPTPTQLVSAPVVGLYVHSCSSNVLSVPSGT